MKTGVGVRSALVGGAVAVAGVVVVGDSAVVGVGADETGSAVMMNRGAKLMVPKHKINKNKGASA
jgi:hypothetical protein